MFDRTKEQGGKTTEAQGQRENTANQGNQGNGSSPFAAPSISLPKGGGAIRGIGEKFAANPVSQEVLAEMKRADFLFTSLGCLKDARPHLHRRHALRYQRRHYSARFEGPRCAAKSRSPYHSRRRSH